MYMVEKPILNTYHYSWVIIEKPFILIVTDVFITLATATILAESRNSRPSSHICQFIYYVTVL